MTRIAFGQIHIKPGQPKENFQTILESIHQSMEKGIDILIFPELCISGYLVGDVWEQPSFIDDCIYYGEEIIKTTMNTSLSIIFGNIGIDRSRTSESGHIRLYNALYVASQGKLVHHPQSPYPFIIKTLLPSYGYFEETRHFTSATVVSMEQNLSLEDINYPITVQTKDGPFTIGPLICEDSWDTYYPMSPTENLIRAAQKLHISIDILVNISSSPFHIHKQEERHELFQKHCEKWHIPIAYVNHVGIQNTGKTICIFDGSSTFYDESGHIYDEAPSFKDLLHVVEIGGPKKSTKTSSSSKTSYIPKLYEALRYGVEQFLTQTGISKVVIGASGGIDSAFNAALYSTILPAEQIYLINMPSQYNSSMTQDLARELAENIGCHYGIVPIHESVMHTTAQIESTPITLLSPTHACTTSNLVLSNLGKENIQARDRSARILSAIASAVGGVFTCNGNKTEFTIGYATMYGDLAGFLCATGDLWKSDVYALSHYMNEEIFQREVIPYGSIHIIPSAELSNDQDITQGLGDPLQYEYHDKLFRSFVEGYTHSTSPYKRLSPTEILQYYEEGSLQDILELPHPIEHYFPTPQEFISDLERWWKCFTGLSVAKRIQSPPILLLRPRAFGSDLRESQMTTYFSRAYDIRKERILSATKEK